MKTIYTICLFLIITLCSSSAFGGYYDYHFSDPEANKSTTENSGGNLEFLLKMTVWINGTNTVTAKIERKDGTRIPQGFIYLQKESNADSESFKIECYGDDYAINDEYSKTLTSKASLDNFPVNWTDDQMSLYARFEQSTGDETSNNYVWTGPIIIQRKINDEFGSLQIEILPPQATDARFRIELPGDLGWTEWYESGSKVDGLNTGTTTVEFKDLSEDWITPNDKTVVIMRGQLTTSSALYLRKESAIQGIILPVEASDAGARWRAEYTNIDGWTSWYESGVVKPDFLPGETRFQCKPLDGWLVEEEQTITVKADQPTTATCTYCKEIPYAPTNVNASDGIFTDKVMITWDSVSCITHYEIYRDNENDPENAERIATSVTGTSYYDETAEPGREFYYWIRGVNERASGDFSDLDIGFKKIESPQNIDAEDGLQVGKVLIKWDKVIGADRYQVYRNTDDNVASAELIASDVYDETYIDENALPQKIYYYWVKAFNSFASSEFSTTDTGYGRIGTPSWIDASDYTYSDKVLIRWEAVKGAAGYEVKYAIRTRSKENPDIVETEYSHTTAIPLKPYYYRVRAYNAYGKGEWSNYDIGRRDMSIPEISASKRTYANRIRVSWQTVDGATYYNVHKNIVDDFTSSTQIASEVIGNYYDDATEDTRTFYYWVEAWNADGKKKSNSDTGYINTDDCEFSITIIKDTFNYNQNTGSVALSCEDTCHWDVSSNDDWITIVSDLTGVGSENVQFRLNENFTVNERTGSIIVAGEKIRIKQDGRDVVQVFLSKDGGGKLEINGVIEKLPFSGAYALGESLSIKAIPDENWEFGYFSGDIIDSENPLQLDVTGNMAITAKFSPKTYSLNISKIGSGVVLINDAETLSGNYIKGTVVKLEAKPYDNFTIWSDGIHSDQNPISVIIDDDLSITARFTGWTTKILAEGVNLGGYYKSDVSIGIAQEKYTQSAPPKPPRYSCYMSIIPKSDWTRPLSRDIREPCDESFEWIVSIDPHGDMGTSNEATSVMKWNPETFSLYGTYVMQKGHEDNGDIVIADMRAVDQFEVTGGSEDQYFTIIWKPGQDYYNDKCDSEPPVDPKAARVNLHFEGENFGGGYKYDAIIGMDQVAEKISAAPKAPDYSCYMTIVPVPDWRSSLAKDIRVIGKNKYEWVILTNPVGNMGDSPNATGQATLSWSIDEDEQQGIFKLVSGYEGDGDVIIDNMQDVSSYEISGDKTDQHFRIIWTPTGNMQCFNIALLEGWNLISLPVIPENSNFKTLFPNAEIAYQYIDGGYDAPESLLPEVGYWIRAEYADTFSICGVPVTVSESKSITPGWRLKGCINENAVPVSSPENAIEVMYEYYEGSYNEIYECQPGYGFWVKTTEECDITITGH
jgi:hypothetical protein